MTDLKALDAAARKTADDIAYYSGGSKHNEPLEKLQTELVRLYRTGKLAPVDGDAVERDMIEADERLGAWMSAALDDPSVCDAMKRDIENWFASFRATLTNGGEHEG